MTTDAGDQGKPSLREQLGLNDVTIDKLHSEFVGIIPHIQRDLNEHGFSQKFSSQNEEHPRVKQTVIKRSNGWQGIRCDTKSNMTDVNAFSNSISLTGNYDIGGKEVGITILYTPDSDAFRVQLYEPEIRNISLREIIITGQDAGGNPIYERVSKVGDITDPLLALIAPNNSPCSFGLKMIKDYAAGDVDVEATAREFEKTRSEAELLVSEDHTPKWNNIQS